MWVYSFPLYGQKVMELTSNQYPVLKVYEEKVGDQDLL